MQVAERQPLTSAQLSLLRQHIALLSPLTAKEGKKKYFHC